MAKYDFSAFDDKAITQKPTSDSKYNFSSFENSPTKSEQISKLESLLRGGAQGASFGFADELAGAGESTLGSLGLVPDKTYEQARNESRANFDAAQQANPLSYTAGQIGGGVASSLLPGGAILNAGKGVGGAIAAGAAIGGVSALGESTASLSNPTELGYDALKGAASGALVGGAVGTLGAGIKAIANSPTSQKMARAFNASKTGESILGEDAANVINNNMLNTVKDVSDKAISKTEAAGKAVGAAKNISPENIIQTQDALDAIAKDLSQSPSAGRVKGVVNDIRDLSANLNREGGLSYAEADKHFLSSIKKQLEEAYPNSKDAELEYEKIVSALKDNNPQLAKSLDEANAQYAIEKTGKAALKDPEASSYSSDVLDRAAAQRSLTQKAKLAASNPTNNASNELNDIAKFTGEPEAIDKLRNLGKDMDVNNYIRENSDYDVNKLLKLAPAKSALIKAADAAGGVANKFNANSGVQAAQDFVSKIGDTSVLGKKVSDILNMEGDARDRALFTLAQQPWFRTVTKGTGK